jgi:eukaryotic-like serine/threonine-protein kinase
LPGLLEDARLRGDLYAQAILQMHGGSCLALAADDPEQARAGLAILERWSNTGFHLEHLVETHNQVEIALYLGDGRKAMDWIRKRWPALERSLLLRVQPLHIQMRSLRARAALLCASQERSGSTRRELLQEAVGCGREIVRQRAPWGRTFAELIQGGVEVLSMQPSRALESFQRAKSAADSAGMLLHAASAVRAQGLLMGGDAGTELLRAAERDLAAEGILNPARMSAVVVPGLPN